MKNDWTSILAIVGPSAVAMAAILVQFFTNRSNNRHHRAELFYNDRLRALTDLNRQVATTIRQMESVLEYKKIMAGKIPFENLFENKGNQMPPELHAPFKEAVLGFTVMAKTRFRDEVDKNGLFYTTQIRNVVNRVETEFFGKIPKPVEPETIDTFIEANIDRLRQLKLKLNEACQKVLMVDKE